MIRMISLPTLLLISQLALAATPYDFDVISSGYLECPDTLKKFTDKEKQKTRFCEASAAVYSHSAQKLYFAADWWGASRTTPLLWVNWKQSKPEGVSNQVVLSSKAPALEKAEDLARTPDKSYVLASPSFTHSAATGYKDWRHINRFIFWPINRPGDMKIASLHRNGRIIAPNELNEAQYSELLRASILKTLRAKYPSTNFFKIEGITFLPGDLIGIGIREIGPDFKHPEYKSILLTTSYYFKDDDLRIGTKFRIEMDLDFKKDFGITEPIGLSSIEYDFDNNRLLMVTSFEQGRTFQDVGAYLWVVEYDPQTQQYASPSAVRKAGENVPYHFDHKVEGVALDNRENLILVSDDDKLTGPVEPQFSQEEGFSRDPSQAHYSTIVIKKSTEEPKPPAQ